MSHESELDRISRELIAQLVNNGRWTDDEARAYNQVIMERSRRLMTVGTRKCRC